MSIVEIFDDRACELTEAPMFDDRTGRVHWVDITGGRVLWRDPQSGETGAIDASGAAGSPAMQEVSAVIPRTNGGLALLLASGPVLLDPDGTVHPLDRLWEGVPVRSNDGKADPGGRLWFGTMARDHSSPIGTLYRLDPGATRAVAMVDGITISNGLGWHGDRMYYNDTPTSKVDVFDYDVQSGAIENRRTFVSVAKPDGLCVDADGYVWVAMWGSGMVRRFAPDGSVDRDLSVPTPQVTCCAFTGADYRTLVITTGAEFGTFGTPGAGIVYAERLDVAGRPADRFAG
jgi:sugar lactone lactonase YvrE